MGSHVEVIEVLLELFHARRNLRHVHGLQSFVHSLDDAHHLLLQLLLLDGRVDARRHCVYPRCQAQIVERLVLLADSVLRVNAGALVIALLNRLLQLRLLLFLSLSALCLLAHEALGRELQIEECVFQLL